MSHCAVEVAWKFLKEVLGVSPSPLYELDMTMESDVACRTTRWSSWIARRLCTCIYVVVVDSKSDVDVRQDSQPTSIASFLTHALTATDFASP